ncbi:hypothetical protein BDZ97DRAFT_1766088 [Flammula alnicola]|nr:hypothetical protein BDZ97DRAFT_1766088 [Flammula alnicola]
MTDARNSGAVIICSNEGCPKTSLDATLLGKACQKAHWTKHKPLCAGASNAPSVPSEYTSLIVAWDRVHLQHIVGYIAGSIYNTFLRERGKDVPPDVWAWHASHYTIEFKLRLLKHKKKVSREDRVRFIEANLIRTEDAILEPERLVRFRQGIHSQPYTVGAIYLLFDDSVERAKCLVTISHGVKFEKLFIGDAVPPTSLIYQIFLAHVPH